jgi:nicotinamide-nucleotide amidase
MPTVPRITLLTFGDELLNGLRSNGHLLYIGKQLGFRGLSLIRSEVVRDDVDEIAQAFKRAWETSDIVITTGGLGPTSDDCTREGVAKGLGVKLVMDAAVKQRVSMRLEAIGLHLDDVHLNLCMRPEGFEPLPNDFGTAPGLCLKYEGKYAIILPGPPQELEPMFERFAMPMFQKDGIGSDHLAYLQVRTVGLHESDVSALLVPLFKNYPGLEVAYCAHPQQVDVRLSPGDLDWDVVKHLANECKAMLGEDFLCFGADSIEQVLVNQLSQAGKTLSIAESCTSGFLGNLITEVPGASKVFLGGVMAYSEDAKIGMLDVPEALIAQHGSVSPEVAVAMAVGVAEYLSTDYALSITGYAGPDGGTSECPVGTVFVGYYSPQGVWSRRLVFAGNSRSIVKQRAAVSALDWLRREIISVNI